MSTITGTSVQQRRLALDRANHVRVARAELKRQLHGGEAVAVETILRGRHGTDTMTVTELLTSQRGWGPRRVAKILRSVSLSEQKTLGSLTERQRLALAAALSAGENDSQGQEPLNPQALVKPPIRAS